MEVFKDYAYYYNAFYQDKDYEKESMQVDKLIKGYGKNVSTIINYGCGTGKHDIELSKLGYKCSGVDMSSDMIRIARQNAEVQKIEINYSVEDIRYFHPRVKYDAVVSLFHVMSYQNRNEDITASLFSARRALSKDGLLLFDVWYGPGVLSDKPAVRVKEVEDEKNRLVRIARPVLHDKTNVVDVNYEVFIIDKETGYMRVIRETHNMRYFFRPELELMLRETGFELIDNLDCQNLGTTNFESWTSYIIARAV